MNPRARAELFLFSVTFIWGSTFVVSKYLLDFFSPLIYIGVRFSIAAILFLVLFPRGLAGLTRRAAIRGGILGALLFSGFASQMIGLQYTSASKSAFITGMMVVFTPIFQLIIERRPPRVGNIIGVVLVAIGLFFLTSPSGSEFNVGDALNLLCALTFALYIVYLDLFSKGEDPVRLTFLQFITTALLGLVGASVFEGIALRLTVESVTALAYLIVFATVVALYLQTRYQKDTTPTRSALIFSIEPVIAAAFAYVTLGEVIGTLGVIGGGLIVGGMLVSELSPA